jgi:hypothetical protein
VNHSFSRAAEFFGSTGEAMKTIFEQEEMVESFIKIGRGKS